MTDWRWRCRCRRWAIYHRDREYARETGDPCLTVVMARNQFEAEKRAAILGFRSPVGLWAHPVYDDQAYD